MKSVCARHEVAYESEKGCPWCEKPPEKPSENRMRMEDYFKATYAAEMGKPLAAPVVLSPFNANAKAPVVWTSCHICCAPASTTVDIGYGKLNACQRCADLYQQTLTKMMKAP